MKIHFNGKELHLLPRELGIRKTFIYISSCTASKKDSCAAVQTTLPALSVWVRVCMCVWVHVWIRKVDQSTDILIHWVTFPPLIRYWVNFPQIQRGDMNIHKGCYFSLKYIYIVLSRGDIFILHCIKQSF